MPPLLLLLPSYEKKQNVLFLCDLPSSIDNQKKKTHTHNIKKTHLPYDFSPSAFFSLDCFFSLPVQFFFFSP